MSEKSKVPQQHRIMASKILDAVIRKIRKSVSVVTEKVLITLSDPGVREKNIRSLKEETRTAVLANLKQKQMIVEQMNTDRRRPAHQSDRPYDNSIF